MDTFEEAQAIRGYESQSIIAMCLFANLHQSKTERQEIKAAWDGADPKPYARAVDMMPGWFDGTVDVGKWELLSLIKIAGVRNKFARALLAAEWQRLTMSYEAVREQADMVNKPKPREKQERHCPHCGEVLP
jgi:hypothetical protein